jgi:hypothetical protein
MITLAQRMARVNGKGQQPPSSSVPPPVTPSTSANSTAARNARVNASSQARPNPNAGAKANSNSTGNGGFNNSNANSGSTGPGPTPQPQATKPSKPQVIRPQPRAVPQKPKKPGVFRSIMGAVAGEVFKNSGVVGKHITHSIAGKRRLGEDAPINTCGGGAVAGIGSEPSDPPVGKKKRKSLLSYGMFSRKRQGKTDDSI